MIKVEKTLKPFSTIQLYATYPFILLFYIGFGIAREVTAFYKFENSYKILFITNLAIWVITFTFNSIALSYSLIVINVHSVKKNDKVNFIFIF